MTYTTAESDERIVVSSHSLNLTALCALLTGLSVMLKTFPLAQLFATTGLILTVGGFTCSHLTKTAGSVLTRFLAVIGAGFLSILLMGAIFGTVLPHIGVSRPLTRVPLVILWLSILAGIALYSSMRRVDPIHELTVGITRQHLIWLSVLCIPPLLALVATSKLNSTGQAAPAIACGVLAVALIVLAILLPSSIHGPPRVMFLASGFLTAAWQVPFRGGWLNGWDIQHEYSVAALEVHQAVFPLVQSRDLFSDPYNGMLSLTVWPAQLHALTGMSLRTILGLVPSIFLVLCLLAVWCAVREIIGERASTVMCALFVLGSEYFVHELPLVTRQCYGLFFFALLLLALVSRRLPVNWARGLVIISGVGIAVTHYSSAYLAAGAVLIGWLVATIFRSTSSSRVLTWPVTAAVVGSTILWGAFVAKTGSGIRQVLHSIRIDGFNFLPTSGNFVSRWINGASISTTVNASVIRATDLQLRKTTYKWMKVDPRSLHTQLVNVNVPSARGVAVLGGLVNIGGTLLAEVLVAAAALSVGLCLWWCRKDRQLAALVGIGIFALAISFVSRLSQTIGVVFDPSRVEAQMYLVFVIMVVVVVSRLTTRWPDRLIVRLFRQWSPAAMVATTVVACLSVGASTQLTGLVQRNGFLPAVYSATGEGIRRIPSTSDLAAAKWVFKHRSAGSIVQTDRFGQLALFDFGYAVRRGLFDTIDPVTVDNSAWVFANHTNIVEHDAQGGNNARVGVFRFPYSYFSSTRSILFVSTTDLVFGSDSIVFAKDSGAGFSQ